MLNVPAPWWNEIAKENKLKTPWGKKYFSMDRDELIKAMDVEAIRLEKQGVSSPVISAFLLFAPMIAEPKAIRAYAKKNPAIRNALLEVNSYQEAVIIASKEYRLTLEQQKELLNLLQTETMVKASSSYAE